MRRLTIPWLVFLPLFAQGPLQNRPIVEVKGTIEKVAIVPGQGMPSLELRTADGTKRVLLGSMRYLLEHNFNPKAGSSLIVKGFQVDQDIVAQRIEIPSEKVSLQFRTEDGTPLWRGGRHRGSK